MSIEQDLVNEIAAFFQAREGGNFAAILDDARAQYPAIILHGEQPLPDHPTQFMLDIFVNTESCCSEKIGRIYLSVENYQAGSATPEIIVEI